MVTALKMLLVPIAYFSNNQKYLTQLTGAEIEYAACFSTYLSLIY